MIKQVYLVVPNTLLEVLSGSKKKKNRLDSLNGADNGVEVLALRHGTGHVTGRGAQFQVANLVGGKVLDDVTGSQVHSFGRVRQLVHHVEHLEDPAPRSSTA